MKILYFPIRSIRTTITQLSPSNLQYAESDNITPNSTKNKPGKVTEKIVYTHSRYDTIRNSMILKNFL